MLSAQCRGQVAAGMRIKPEAARLNGYRLPSSVEGNCVAARVRKLDSPVGNWNATWSAMVGR